MSSNKPALSIITATYQSGAHLEGLIASLREQTCKDFEWIVADGNSSDGTVDLLKSVSDVNISWVSEHDFGIYDAMNKAIKRSAANYYLVVGSDDVLEKNAVEIITKELTNNKNCDVLVGQVFANGVLMKRRQGKSWLYGATAFVTAHSVGTVFKKDLHIKFGFYNNHYPILADSYFMKTIFQSKQINVKYIDDVFGTFGTNGISNTATLRSYCEYLHIQLVTEKFKFLQILLFVIRYIKYRLT